MDKIDVEHFFRIQIRNYSGSYFSLQPTYKLKAISFDNHFWAICLFLQISKSAWRLKLAAWNSHQECRSLRHRDIHDSCLKVLADSMPPGFVIG